ncbi:MAG: hypothetical protein ACLQQ4_16155 [Bacteroidia bacterium]
MQNWKKKGLIYSGNTKAGFSYASLPIGHFIKAGVIRIYFSMRNSSNASYPFYLDYDLHQKKIINESVAPILNTGEIGKFDDSGVMPTCLVKNGSELRMYYIGWNLGVTVPFRNSVGIAVSKDGGDTFSKLFEGPVLDRTKTEPHFCASCCVITESDKWKIWYLSCVKWKLINNIPVHYYHIKYAESNDGIDWERQGVVAIDFEHENENAISVPRVIKENGIYKMWYSYRENGKIRTYRVGYAESKDGKKWQRKDDEVLLDVSKDGWDSDMVCYPYIFDYNGDRYMLYNGNGYGKTGFGLAVLEK